MIRIDKFLSQMQVATRSESKKLIKMKRITKNGALVTDGGEKCDPKKDCICLDGHPIAYQEYHYLMLHKPAGCVTATEDRRDKTVMDICRTICAVGCPRWDGWIKTPKVCC